MTRNWKPYSYNGTLLSAGNSFIVKLKPRTDGKPGYQHFWPRVTRATKSPAGRARYLRRVKNGAK